MRPTLLATILLAGFVLAFGQMPQQTTPYWAYAVNPATATAKVPDDTVLHVPNSSAGFSRAQLQDLFTVPDWHASDHPAMPEIVAHGRKPTVYACGYCHLPNGLGRPENANLAGLPAGYIVRQLADYGHGVRKSSEPKFLPATNMTDRECKATDEEISVAADYFSRLPRKRWIRVVESNTVPKTHVAGWMLVADTPPATEPIGQRIIEMPEDLERTELRDDRSGFVAYVPEGSLKAGKWLATSGENGKTAPCAKCHGPGLRGGGNAPPISGRSPSYLVRQLYDFKSGARAGTASQEMRPMVAKLSIDDMIAIAAYVSSLKP